ncbi:DUF7718 family protein [Thermus scotoductus]|uniref:DUF7718 domain-containing protein n=1 Tax=Thermus scotoductus TaxID=37636 RepID=A0A430RG63_THESC|nr:hypothetical protein CSW47_02745 [Thermus scotoductus]RTH21774.1 hypothetical protein CSW40_12185 [Thermus scotoductus]
MGSQQREFPFALDRRLRLTLRVERGKLVAWAVQLEWFDAEEGRWVWVARYDTAGGRPHRDRNRLGTEHPKAPHAGAVGRLGKGFLARAPGFLEVPTLATPGWGGS